MDIMKALITENHGPGQWKVFRHSYLFGIAVDSEDPQNVIVSASTVPGSAYTAEDAESFVYRRDEDGKKWKAVSNGLPKSGGTTVSLLSSDPDNAGQFYAVNNHGIFYSDDSGVSWTSLKLSPANPNSLRA